MSKLDDLLQKLCPNGVEYKKLEDIFYMKNGYTPSKSNPKFWENGTIPWFRMEDIRENGRILTQAIQCVTKEAIKGNIFSANSIIVSTSATIGEHALITVDFLANQRFTCLSIKEEYKELFDIKFLFYYCYKLDDYCLNNLNQGNFASVDMKKLSSFQIPIPPLEVQSEIVRIMDNFTELTAELTAELSARRKQYEYYRDSLLTFGDDVPVYSLSEIATDIYRGSGIKRDEVTETGTECVRYGEIYTKYNIHFDTCFSHTQLETVKSPKYFEHGDILFAITGESVEDISKSTVYTGNNKCLAGGDIVVVKHNQNPKYLGYVLSTTNLKQQKQKGKVKSKVVHASVADIGNLRVPIPPMEEQERIVSILDRFDTLCNDLTSGLPAEIEARQKQYEYYRDKLLDFKKAE